MATQSTEGDQEDARISKRKSFEKLHMLILSYSSSFSICLFFVSYSLHPSSFILSHSLTHEFFILFFFLILSLSSISFFYVAYKNSRKRTWGYNDFITRSLRRSYIVFNIPWAHHPVNEWFRRFSRSFFVPLFFSSCISTIAQANLRNHLWTVLDTPANHISRLSTLSSTAYNTCVY